MSRISRLFIAAAGALAAIARGGATLGGEDAAFLMQRHDSPPPEEKRARKKFRDFRRMAGRVARTHFLKRDARGPRWRGYLLPHSAPMAIAIVRDENGKRQYKPALDPAKPPKGTVRIEHINGFGQVVRRERVAGESA